MSTSKPAGTLQKLLSQVQLARVQLAKCKSEFESNQEEAQLAKRRRKLAKEAARRAKKLARRTRKAVAEAEVILAEAEASLAHARKPATRTRRKKRRIAKIATAKPSRKTTRKATARISSPAKPPVRRSAKPRKPALRQAKPAPRPAKPAVRPAKPESSAPLKCDVETKPITVPREFDAPAEALAQPGTEAAVHSEEGEGRVQAGTAEGQAPGEQREEPHTD